MYLTPTSKYWAMDIEGDPIPSTKIYCACVENVTTGEKLSFVETESLSEWVNERLKEGCKFIFHNGIGYDAPTLNRLLGTRIRVTDIIDTMVLSQLYNPSLPGGHSLAAWGTRLKSPKIDFEDFSKFTLEMLTYCAQDTKLCKGIYVALYKRLRALGFSEESIELEHRAWSLVLQQRRNGFAFNIEEAHILYARLREIETEIKEEILKLWPPELEKVRTYKAPYKKNGDPSHYFTVHSEQFEKVVVREKDNEYDCYDYVEFHIGSPIQRVEKLLDLGWKPLPTELTKTGQPQPTKKGRIVPSLEEFVEKSNHEGPRLIARWMDINARGNNVNTWIEAYNENTGCIHGSLWLANTHRYKHSSPNTANIPAVRVDKDDKPLFGIDGVFTYESRALWQTRDPSRRRLVGVDAKGIQLRVLAHYLNNEGFTKNILSSDPHSANQELFGLPSRALTKTITYACVPMDTKALTKRGWKTYDELEEGELVLSFNAEKRVQEWTPLLEKVLYDDAPVVEMSHGESFSVRSTPNHRWFTTNRQFNRWAGRVEKNAEKPIVVKTTEELGTISNVIVNAPLHDDDDKDTESSDYQWMSLSKYGTDWVQVVLDMSQRERAAFLAGFCIADGYSTAASRWRWSQVDGPLFEAALLASYLVHDGRLNVSDLTRDKGRPMKNVLLNQKPHVTTAFFKYKELERQPVWCIRTKNESWVMRQGDVITITGNTLMGAGDARIAAESRVTLKEAKATKAKFFDQLPQLPRLIERLQVEAERTGRITLCDGSKIVINSPHTVIPFLLQGDESKIMKKTLILLEREARKKKLDWLQVGFIHDEYQFDVLEEHVEDFVKIVLDCFVEAGKSFNYNIPIEGDAKVGLNWSETH